MSLRTQEAPLIAVALESLRRVPAARQLPKPLVFASLLKQVPDVNSELVFCPYSGEATW